MAKLECEVITACLHVGQLYVAITYWHKTGMRNYQGILCYRLEPTGEKTAFLKVFQDISIPI